MMEDSLFYINFRVNIQLADVNQLVMPHNFNPKPMMIENHLSLLVTVNAAKYSNTG